jgi:hypothetical protein
MGYGHKHLWLSLTFLTVAAAAFYVASRIMSGNYAFLSVMTGLLALYPFLICLISWIAQLYGILLSGADSLHVASAFLDECVEFLTLDGKLKKRKFAKAISELHKLGLRVVRPSQTSHLPNEYRTTDLFDAQNQEARPE